jgi:hypothetical protein
MLQPLRAGSDHASFVATASSRCRDGLQAERA